MLRAVIAVPALLALAACGSATSRAAPTPTVAAAPTAGAGCVDAAAARAIWTTINNRLNAIQLDPNHAGLADVSTGAALTVRSDYIRTTLTDKHLTEREVDRLDNLSVTNGGCTGGALTVDVTITLTKDDYLRADGTVDHADASVGTQFERVITYVRTGGVWKESDITDLGGGQTQAPSLV
jgi:hypothetical protein